MELPKSLPARLYLLAYDTRKQRRRYGTGHLGQVLNAAALAQLFLDGHLVDSAGRAERGTTAAKLTDPVLALVLDQVAGAQPRRWARWVGRGTGAMVRAVQEQLADGRWIRVEPRRVLGLFPGKRITLREPWVATQLSRQVTQALRGTQRASEVDPLDAAAVALAVAGELPAVVSRAQRRDNKRRIAELSESSGPAVPALRTARRQAHSAASAG